ncbi:MAG: uracil-DNA glycosylase, partial [Alphaproteobacteria bacterium]|nr:uracil-DNA glycosylase [Alphaproteobacteria bacterium]
MPIAPSSHCHNHQPEPAPDCSLCPRLTDFRTQNSAENPSWFNGAVPSFGNSDARLLVVGLAPGLKGANKTGRPFTGDYAGDLLYATLAKYGFAKGTYRARADDGLKLVDCMISNAVRCVPPKNKPIGSEIKTCGRFLADRIATLPNLKVIIALGRVAHDSSLTAIGAQKKAHAFGHAESHAL